MLGTDQHALQPPRTGFSSPTTYQLLPERPSTTPMPRHFLLHLIHPTSFLTSPLDPLALTPRTMTQTMHSPSKMHHPPSPVLCPTNPTPPVYSPQLLLTCRLTTCLTTSLLLALLPFPWQALPLSRLPNPNGSPRVDHPHKWVHRSAILRLPPERRSSIHPERRSASDTNPHGW